MTKEHQFEAIDGYTSASVHFFYEDSSFQKEDVIDIIEKRQAATFLATTNPDNTPNLAVVIPGVVDKETIMLGLLENQTKQNLLRTKNAILGLYLYKPEEKDKKKRNQGARVRLFVITDEKKKNEYMQKTGAREGTIFLHIQESLPLG